MERSENIEITSSNDCTTDEPTVGEDQSSCFLPSQVDSMHTASNSLDGIVYEPPPNGFVPEESSSSMLGHEAFNGIIPPVEDELDDNDDQDSTISELSGLSDLSNFNGQDWKPNAGPITWVQRQMISGVDPRMILGELLPKGTCVPYTVNDGLLWRLIVNLLSEPKRTKLAHINTLDDALSLLKTCKKIIVLTGAGVSVSCGIPDFRSRDGIYARLKKDYPALPDPQAMFDIQYFRRDPRPFFKFAKEIYPGQFEPSPSHRFIKVLEKHGKLLRNYSQNIDTLEHAAGIQNVITCHGSFATATCTICGHKVDSSSIKDDIFQQTIPYCPICHADVVERGIMKPDIVFFGEGLSDEFHEAMASDKEVCDLLIVVGSSLKVRPVAMIPSSIPTTVPQILINREPLDHLTFDIELLGDCDVIIGELCRRLESEWEIDKRIPRFDLKEISVQKAEIPDATHSAEVNNNSSNNSCDLHEAAPSNLCSQNEESNSCDYRGMSAIKLDDSEDGSNQERPQSTSSCSDAIPNTVTQQKQRPETVDNTALWPADSSMESLSKRIPDKSFLFFTPNRYVFPGAEVYKEREQDLDDDRCSTPTDYSSDCDSPVLPIFESPADTLLSVATSEDVPTATAASAESSCNLDPTIIVESKEESPNT